MGRRHKWKGQGQAGRSETKAGRLEHGEGEMPRGRGTVGRQGTAVGWGGSREVGTKSKDNRRDRERTTSHLPPLWQCRARCVPSQHLLSEALPQKCHILPDLHYKVPFTIPL